ncbi:uncharacterized protein MICPUCDRAFT_59575 [Micromonas pusilla CCMP1545]|uniref:Predicted protein n=1 Tax=Micromonas pusilla (strain CCMP1545) TaxID=564608 RepID=C1MW02_MICPC|nr:uncharacterized protein MICPUCDRAFT_59575 [Micromonas pusilla CCMP1545]EEH56079.1 predicted protein [Micromonas pusilla CCMP1545]|eukprot:XP_003060127.1 predicted protein [Micromonas pusilla CCMP1545]
MSNRISRGSALFARCRWFGRDDARPTPGSLGNIHIALARACFDFCATCFGPATRFRRF